MTAQVQPHLSELPVVLFSVNGIAGAYFWCFNNKDMAKANQSSQA